VVSDKGQEYGAIPFWDEHVDGGQLYLPALQKQDAEYLPLVFSFGVVRHY
jgi:hypothetical protein